MLCQLFLRIHLTDKTTNQANAIPSTQDFTFFKLKWSHFFLLLLLLPRWAALACRISRQEKAEVGPTACTSRESDRLYVSDTHRDAQGCEF